jgi:Flp pilus assembly protein TadB
MIRRTFHRPADRAERQSRNQDHSGETMIVLGVILIILAAVLDIPFLYTIGIILAVVGAILWILGAMGRAIGPRSHYW